MTSIFGREFAEETQKLLFLIGERRPSFGRFANIAFPNQIVKRDIEVICNNLQFFYRGNLI